MELLGRDFYDRDTVTVARDLLGKHLVRGMLIICEHIPAVTIQWPGVILPLVLAWYIITELGSILENAVKMGAAVPGWLVKLLEAGAKAMENAGADVG